MKTRRILSSAWKRITGGATSIMEGVVSRPRPRRLQGGTRPDKPPRIARRLTHDQIEYALMDTQVRVAYQVVESLLLSREFILTRPDDSDEARMLYDFIDNTLRSMRTNLRSLRKELYKGLLYGFSVNEIVYEYKDGRIVPEKIIPVHPATLSSPKSWIYDEESGEFLGVRQDFTGLDLLFGASEAAELIPSEKLLIYTHGAAHGLMEGESILREVYDHVDMKQNALKWLLVYLQKYENPVMVGKAANPQYKEDLLAQLEMIEEGLSKITVGRDDEVQVIESQHRGDAFFEFIKYNDNMILRRFFIGTLLLGQSDRASGSYSQSQTQLEVTRLVLDGLHEDIAEAIQGLIDRLVTWNFGEEYRAHAPKAGFEPLQEKDLTAMLQTLQPYASNLIIDPTAEWFQSLIEAYVNQEGGLNVTVTDGSSVSLEELPYDESDELLKSLTGPAEGGAGEK